MPYRSQDTPKIPLEPYEKRRPLEYWVNQQAENLRAAIGDELFDYLQEVEDAEKRRSEKGATAGQGV